MTCDYTWWQIVFFTLGIIFVFVLAWLLLNSIYEWFKEYNDIKYKIERVEKSDIATNRILVDHMEQVRKLNASDKSQDRTFIRLDTKICELQNTINKIRKKVGKKCLK